jgi:flagellar biosynthesis anti-sigma factor FlgM
VLIAKDFTVISLSRAKVLAVSVVRFIRKTKELTMRIDGFQNIPALLHSSKADKTIRSQSGNENDSSSSVSLSSFAEVLQSLQRTSAQAAKSRSNRVEQLADQAASGNLSVDTMKLATRLVDLQVIDIKG